jgi:hypothetical protein
MLQMQLGDGRSGLRRLGSLSKRLAFHGWLAVPTILRCRFLTKPLHRHPRRAAGELRIEVIDRLRVRLISRHHFGAVDSSLREVRGCTHKGWGLDVGRGTVQGRN